MNSISRITRVICLPLILGLLAAPAFAQQDEDAAERDERRDGA